VAAFTSGAPVCRHRVRRIKGPLPGLRLSSLWERADGGGRGQGQGKETGDGDGEAASGGRTEREREREGVGGGGGRATPRVDTVRNGAEGFRLAARLSPGVTLPLSPPPLPPLLLILLRARTTADFGC